MADLWNYVSAIDSPNKEIVGQIISETSLLGKKRARKSSDDYQWQKLLEKFFWIGIWACALSVIVLVFSIFVSLFAQSFLSLKKFGISFLFGTSWNPVFGDFGALPFVLGTLTTSFLALLISFPFSFSIALFIGEYFEGSISSVLKTAVELLAGIPSIIYGFWGLFVLVPLVRNLEMKWGIPPYGVGVFTSAILLALMIIPFSASLSQETIRLVPKELKEAAFSMGATHWDVIRKVILPYSFSGIFAGNFLALGRALGETMAVTMVIGNSNRMIKSIFEPSNTMASVIANEFAEATEEIYLSSLVEIGLLLFLITMLINIIGKKVIQRLKVEN